MLNVDGGDLFFGAAELKADYVPQATRKAELIADAMSAVGLDAYTPGEFDFALGVDQLLRLRDRAEFPFVSANLRASAGGELLFQPHVVVKSGPFSVGILGVTDPSLLFVMDDVPHADDILAAARVAVTELQALGVDAIVAIAHTSRRGGELLAREIPAIDLVCGVHGEDIDFTPGKLRPPTLQVAESAYPRGKALAGRKLFLKESRRANGRHRAEPVRLLVRSTLPHEPVVAALIDGYKSDLATINVLVDAEETPLTAFVGGAACDTCHTEEAAHWGRTAHARAYQTLIDVGHQYDLECIGCHTLGIDTRAELSNTSLLESMRDVQCEHCHGPLAGHPEKDIAAHPVTSRVCTKCHRDEHDEDFDFAVDLKLATCLEADSTLDSKPDKQDDR